MTNNTKRNIFIAVLLVLILYLAKMEAINFIVAVWLGVWVTVKLWALEIPYYRRDNRLIGKSLRFPFSVFAEISSNDPGLNISLKLSVLAGIISIYLVYSLLNELFIPAK